MHTHTARKLLLFLFVANIVVTCALWWVHSGDLFMQGTTMGYTISLGRLAGLLAEIVLLTEIVLVARIRWIEEWFGNDKMVALHRTVGFSILTLFVAHVVLVDVAYSIRSHTTLMAQLFSMIDTWSDVRNAAIAVLLFSVIGLSSMKVIRSCVQYETWYGIHFLTYLGIILAFSHQIQDGDMAQGTALYYWLVLNAGAGLLFLGYRWVLPSLNSRYHHFVVEKVVQEHPLIFSVYITGKHMDQFTFDGGQYATVLFHLPWFFYSHPFSISQAYNGHNVRFTIKNLGSWTAAMGQVQPGTRVSLGGPYGRFTREASSRNKFLLIAGGIGISPIVSLAQDLARTYTQKDDVVAMYSARTKAELALRDELVATVGKCTCFTSEPTDAVAIKGVIDADAFRTHVPDVAARDVYICGPLPMMQALTQTLLDLGVPKHQIHFEKFAY